MGKKNRIKAERAKNTAESAVYDYLEELGFRTKGSVESRLQRLGALNGPDFIQKVQDQKNWNDRYTLIFQDPDTAVIMSEMLGLDTYPQILFRIYENRKFIRGDVLDAGCGAGIVTLFVAKLFPQLHITGVDRCAAAVDTARKLAEQLGVTNVTFVHSAVADLPDKKYETVLSVRTVSDNYEDFIEDYTLPFTQRAEVFAAAMGDFAESLTRVTAPSGMLISFESGERDTSYLGWLSAVSRGGLDPCMHSELMCGDRNKTPVQATVFASLMGGGMMTPFQFFCEIYVKGRKFDRARLEGMDAEVMLDMQRGDLIKGVVAKTPDGVKLATLSVWKTEYIKDGILYFLSRGDINETTLVMCSVYDLEMVEAAYNRELNGMQAGGLTVTELATEDGYLKEKE